MANKVVKLSRQVIYEGKLIPAYKELEVDADMAKYLISVGAVVVKDTKEEAAAKPATPIEIAADKPEAPEAEEAKPEVKPELPQAAPKGKRK